MSEVKSKIKIAVVGAHLSGQPLNYQLIERGATLLLKTCTAPNYRLYALSGTTPAKPGLVRQDSSHPAYNIEVEVWEIEITAFGGFVVEVPPPLGIGTTILENGETVKGFICENWAIADALDISEYGGWRAYRNSLCNVES
jgi:allophanate hydrolase